MQWPFLFGIWGSTWLNWKGENCAFFILKTVWDSRRMLKQTLPSRECNVMSCNAIYIANSSLEIRIILLIFGYNLDRARESNWVLVRTFLFFSPMRVGIRTFLSSFQV